MRNGGLPLVTLSNIDGKVPKPSRKLLLENPPHFRKPTGHPARSQSDKENTDGKERREKTG
jgi:hypothetical protein